MAEEDKCLPRPIFCRDLSWDPFCGWPRQSKIFDQDFGAPPIPAPCDRSWATSLHPSANPLQPLPAGASEVLTGRDRWQVNLDVNQFSPEEISIKTREGYLEIIGQHEERQDEHGFVSRYFTRKYRLPAGMDLQRISSYLSGDGVLSVQGPLPAPSVSDETVIPIQVEKKLEPPESKEKKDQVEVDLKTEETTGVESEGKTVTEMEGLEGTPMQPPSDKPEGEENPQQPPVLQPESSVVQGEGHQGDASKIKVEADKEAAISLAEEVPAQPEGDTAEERVDPKLAHEGGDADSQLEEASHQQYKADVAMDRQGEPNDTAQKTEIQQDSSGEPGQASSGPATVEEPQPAPSQEAQVPHDEAPIPEQHGPSSEQEVPIPEQEVPSPKQEALSHEEEAPIPEQDNKTPKQDVTEQQEIKHAEFTKGPPEL